VFTFCHPYTYNSRFKNTLEEIKVKRSIWVFVTCLTVLMLVVVNIGSANAKKIEAPSLPVPVVTFVSGDKEFETEVISTADLEVPLP
jgi:hypothetical protein